MIIIQSLMYILDYNCLSDNNPTLDVYIRLTVSLKIILPWMYIWNCMCPLPVCLELNILVQNVFSGKIDMSHKILVIISVKCSWACPFTLNFKSFEFITPWWPTANCHLLLSIIVLKALSVSHKPSTKFGIYSICGSCRRIDDGTV